mgnify:CR=1 FL=1
MNGVYDNSGPKASRIRWVTEEERENGVEPRTEDLKKPLRMILNKEDLFTHTHSETIFDYNKRVFGSCIYRYLIVALKNICSLIFKLKSIQKIKLNTYSRGSNCMPCSANITAGWR